MKPEYTKPTLLGILNIFEEMTKMGLLHRDPANHSNILVCREKDGKEAWYSENACDLADETLHDEKILRDLLDCAAEAGVDGMEQFRKANMTIEQTNRILGIFEQKDEKMKCPFQKKISKNNRRKFL